MYVLHNWKILSSVQDFQEYKMEHTAFNPKAEDLLWSISLNVFYFLW